MTIPDNDGSKPADQEGSSAMRYISLFSGIEAASVAWEPLGWKPVCFAELDRFPSAVLAERYPTVPNVGDVTKVNWKKYKGKCDVVVGGSPCQSFSVAGKREGLSGESGLMFEYIRAVREVRPRWFLWENVPGALSSEGGEAFRQLLSEMDALGYGLAWRVLDAQFFGVAQRRERLFLVGHFGACPPVEVLFEPEVVQWHPAPSREKRAQLAAAAGRGAEGAGFERRRGSGTGGVGGMPHDGDPAYTLQAVHPHMVAECPIGMADLAANTAIDENMVGTMKVGGDAPAVCLVENSNGQGIVGAIQARDSKGVGSQFVNEGKVMLILDTSAFDAEARGCGDVCIQGSVIDRTESNGPAGGGIKTDGSCYTLNCSDRHSVLAPDMPVVRRLTPMEWERLQGFPDNWTRIAWRGKPAEECPDGPRYKAIGNSMAVPVMRWIGERIALAERGNNEL